MIGIVGGVGPYAGLDLLRKVYDQTLAGKDQDHLDTLLLSLPSSILDRTEYLTGKVEENPGKAIAQVIMRLERTGATVAGIPCNTAHVKRIFGVVTDELQQEGCRIRMMHMIEETVSFIQNNFPHLKKIGVLSTTGTYLSGIYKDALEKRGFRVVLPAVKMQEEKIHTAIYHPEYGIKSVSNPVHPKAREHLLEGFDHLRKEGSEAVILGCTEIPVAFPGRTIRGMVAIDPTLVLARALIAFEAPEKLKPYSS